MTANNSARVKSTESVVMANSKSPWGERNEASNGRHGLTREVVQRPDEAGQRVDEALACQHASAFYNHILQ